MYWWSAQVRPGPTFRSFAYDTHRSSLDDFFALDVVFSLSAWLGTALRQPQNRVLPEDREDFGVVLAAALTLLGLIIGFTFSMAISRYDLRKNYEEAEANAIGTEYTRADLLAAEGAATLRRHLKDYTDLRLKFYGATDRETLKDINAATNRLQQSLWSDVKSAAQSQPNPITALVIAGDE